MLLTIEEDHQRASHVNCGRPFEHDDIDTDPACCKAEMRPRFDLVSKR